MNTSLHIPSDIANRLTKFLDEQEGKTLSRNKVIVEAIAEYLDRQEKKKEWSPKLLEWFSQPEITEEFDLSEEDHDWGDFSFDK